MARDLHRSAFVLADDASSCSNAAAQTRARVFVVAYTPARLTEDLRTWRSIDRRRPPLPLLVESCTYVGAIRSSCHGLRKAFVGPSRRLGAG
jgi:hypothetical protein